MAGNPHPVRAPRYYPPTAFFAAAKKPASSGNADHSISPSGNSAAATAEGGIDAVIALRDGITGGLIDPGQGSEAFVNAGRVRITVRLNPTAADFATRSHAGPDGGQYFYNSGASMAQLNAAWPAGTPVGDRIIERFPERSIETKPVYMLVRRDGLSAVPYWTSAANSTNPPGPTPDTWQSCVLFDPDVAAPLQPVPDDVQTAIDGGRPVHVEGLACEPPYLYAGLDQIYSFALTDDDRRAFATAPGGASGPGDFAVLVAMHVITKELPNWTWATFLWTGGVSPPNDFPAHFANQPADLVAPWNNYALCTSNWERDLDGGIRVCMSPYLEADLPGNPDGLNSNCLSCHLTARSAPLLNAAGPNTLVPRNYLQPVEIGPGRLDPIYFATGPGGNTRTDSSWLLGLIANEGP